MGCFEFLPKRPECEGKTKDKSIPPSGENGSKTAVNSGSHTLSESSIKSDVDANVTSEIPGKDPPAKHLSHSGSLLKPNDLKNFAFHELRYATKNFDRKYLLGEGGFGQVFRGSIRHKQKFGGGDERIDVAVKQLNSRGQQGHKEWLAEVHFLGLVDSPHLVKLIGYCANDDDERGIQRLLVYEYMQNKGLDDHLFRPGPIPLSWSTRVKIILGAARGLSYLHEELEFQVIFRDFKTSNVLLDEDFNPKLSDFGLARLGPQDGDSYVSTAVVGTAGYAAPEYVQTGHLTVKSDVWSFGIVMLEVLTGRRVMDKNRPRNEQVLIEWAKPHISDHHKLFQIVDPLLNGRYPVKVAQRFAQLAYQCLSKIPKNRPRMSDIVERLKIVQERTFQWESPSKISSQKCRASMDSRTVSSVQELARPSVGSPRGLPLGSLSAIQSGKVSKFSPKVSDNADVSKQVPNLSLEGYRHSPKHMGTSGSDTKSVDTLADSPKLLNTRGEKQGLEKVGGNLKHMGTAREEPKLLDTNREEPKSVQSVVEKPKLLVVTEESKLEEDTTEKPKAVVTLGEDPLAAADVTKQRSRISFDRFSRTSRESGRFNWIARLSFSLN